MYIVHRTRIARCRITEDMNGAETVRAWLDRVMASNPANRPVSSLHDQLGRYAARRDAVQSAAYADYNSIGRRNDEVRSKWTPPPGFELADIQEPGEIVIRTTEYEGRDDGWRDGPIPGFQSEHRPAPGRDGSPPEIPAGYPTFDEWPGV